MAGSGFGICFPKTSAQVGCGVCIGAGWWAGAPLYPLWSSDLLSGYKLKSPNEVREFLPNIRKTSGAIGRKPQKRKSFLLLIGLLQFCGRTKSGCFAPLFTHMLDSQLDFAGGIPWVEGLGCGVQACGRMALCCCQMWREQCSVPLKPQPTAGAPATDVPRVGWWPSSYAYHWECILIQMLKLLFELKSLA